MDRLKNLVLGSAHAFEDNDSLMSSDFNWNDISVGNDTIGCEKFFRKYIHFVFVPILSGASSRSAKREKNIIQPIKFHTDLTSKYLSIVLFYRCSSCGI